MNAARPHLLLRLLAASACAASLAACVTDMAAEDDLAAGDGKADGAGDYVVNGRALNTRERQWMHYVAEHVIPDLPGTWERKLEIASRTAWWSLKEGIFDTMNPAKYSNCNTASGDRLIGPLETCGAGRAWQVGLAAVQVPNHTLAQLEAIAREVYPDRSIADVLAAAAGEAGFAAGGETAQAIVESTGSLRKSWILRNSAVGFTACERDEVVPECIEGSLSWCYGTGWDTTRWFAPNKAAAMRAIDDIERLLARLANAPATPWIGSTCSTDAECTYDGAFCLLPAGGGPGFCSRSCEGYCPDRAGRAPTFCIASSTGGGTCVAKADPLNHQCADIAGTYPQLQDRYVGSSSVPMATAEVCAY